MREQRLDETEVGEGTTVTLIDARRPADWAKTFTATDASAYLGLDREAEGLVGWDVFDAVLTPGRPHPAHVVAHRGGCGSVRADG